MVKERRSVSRLPRNVWAASFASFFMDVSSEMVLNILPLFLANVLGVRTYLIGIIEGFAESTASLLKVFSGWLSDKLRGRKWLAVIGYAISALSRPFFYWAGSWGSVAAIRWVDRLGKGVRTAPRDALLADSVDPSVRGLAFGLHRAADTAGAVIGLAVVILLVWHTQSHQLTLGAETFRLVVIACLFPAGLSVLALAIGAQDVPVAGRRKLPGFAYRSLGKRFMSFLIIIGIFELGNSSDAFLVLRAQERGISVMGVLGMLLVFNVVYTLISTPAGALSDRVGRKRVLLVGWILYAIVYGGFGMAKSAVHIVVLYGMYGIYYGLTYGTYKAVVADIVPETLRGTAYGTFHAVLGLMDFPASVIAGVLWQGVGKWPGFGPGAPFLFGAVMAVLASVLLFFWKTDPQLESTDSGS